MKKLIMEMHVSDRLKEYCGVVAVCGHPEASKLAYLGLYALQHRGQEGAGIVVNNDGTLHGYHDMGLVADVFDEKSLADLEGSIAIGHVRYSTFGGNALENVQPVLVDYARGSVALAHNGNLVNGARLRLDLSEHGSIFQSTTDSEVIVHLVAKSRATDFVDSVLEALRLCRGAYSLAIMNNDVMVAVRDPFGSRPLALGKLGDAHIVASESCAFDVMDAEFVREIEPGEMVVIDRDGRMTSSRPLRETRHAHCIFEHIYFARPDSLLFGANVGTVRHRLGEELAREAPAEADFVMPVPDSATGAALGYAHASGIPFDMGLIRNHYIGRTFIEPEQQIRDFGARVKYNPVRGVLDGKRVVVMEDSIVRGTTMRKIVNMLRTGGAAEIHMRISSAPLRNPCFYGIDIPTREELIASTHSVEALRDFFQVDSLHYLSLEGMVRASGLQRDEYCLACFDGNYPVMDQECIEDEETCLIH